MSASGAGVPISGILSLACPGEEDEAAATSDMMTTNCTRKECRGVIILGVESVLDNGADLENTFDRGIESMKRVEEMK